MPKLPEGLRRRGNSIQAFVHDASGKQHPKSFKIEGDERETIRQAVQWRREMKALLGRGELPEKHRKHDQPRTMQELADAYLRRCERKGLADNTVRRYRSNFDNHLRGTVLSGIKLEALALEHVELWADERADGGASARTIVDIRGLLSQVWGWGAERRYCDAQHNPFSALELSAPDRKSVRALTAVELQQLLAAFDCEDAHDVALGMAYIGCRISDVVRVKVFDVQPHTNKITIGNKKSQDNAKRTLIMPAPLREMVMPRLSEGGPELLRYTSRQGRAGWSPENYRHVWNRAAKRADMEEVTPHWMRHTCASYLIAQGANIVQVANWLGHKNIETTLRHYAHMYEGDMQSLSDMMGGLMPESKLRRIV